MPWVRVGVAVALAGLAAAVVWLMVRGQDGRPPDVAGGHDGDEVTHVHGLGVDPGDGRLYAATHNGLFVITEDGRAQRVGSSHQDTMGFTVVGRGHFLASGHPDMSDQALRVPGKPPLLGLVESRDGGVTWKPLSLLGEADFHALAAAHGKVYGVDSTTAAFMVSEDGRDWEVRSTGGIATFAVDPDDEDHIVAATAAGLAESRDGGRSFHRVDGPPLVVLSWSTGGLWGATAGGETYHSTPSGWERRTELGGRPQALVATGEAVHAAVEVEAATTILSSEDGGETWRVLYSTDPH